MEKPHLLRPTSVYLNSEMKTHFILLILSGCLLLSFQNLTLPQKNTLCPQIIGTWQLVKTGGGITGLPHLVDTSTKMLVTFNEDGTYFRSDKGKKRAGSYLIRCGQCHTSRPDEYAINYYENNDPKSGNIEGYVLLEADTLYAGRCVGDVISEMFTRIK